MGQLDGHCLCGAVSYVCDAAPVSAFICHCRDCQRASGAACAVVVGVPRTTLRISGEDTLGAHVTADEDGDGNVTRQFCTECGSPLFSLPDRSPELVLIKAGTLDDTSQVRPEMERCGESRHRYLDAQVN